MPQRFIFEDSGAEIVQHCPVHDNIKHYKALRYGNLTQVNSHIGLFKLKTRLHG